MTDRKTNFIFAQLAALAAIQFHSGTALGGLRTRSDEGDRRWSEPPRKSLTLVEAYRDNRIGKQATSCWSTERPAKIAIGRLADSSILEFNVSRGAWAKSGVSAREKVRMVDYCANPNCGKTLHYLREGTVFLFEVSKIDPDDENGRSSRLEHFWLCGKCSATHLLERTTDGEVRLSPRRTSPSSRSSLVAATKVF